MDQVRPHKAEGSGRGWGLITVTLVSSDPVPATCCGGPMSPLADEAPNALHYRLHSDLKTWAGQLSEVMKALTGDKDDK